MPPRSDRPERWIGLGALVSGALLTVVPRYVLPACEYQGFPAMHCSRTVRGEMVAGALLAAIGIATQFLRRGRWPPVAGFLALALVTISFLLPEALGYCHSPRMPCTYGMVPAVRFIAVGGALVSTIGLVARAREVRRRDSA